jgi:hypothetical protein
MCTYTSPSAQTFFNLSFRLFEKDIFWTRLYTQRRGELLAIFCRCVFIQAWGKVLAFFCVLLHISSCSNLLQFIIQVVQEGHLVYTQRRGELLSIFWRCVFIEAGGKVLAFFLYVLLHISSCSNLLQFIIQVVQEGQLFGRQLQLVAGSVAAALTERSGWPWGLDTVHLGRCLF